MSKVIIILLLVVLFVSIVPLITMWLWNYVMPGVFNLPEIGYWQAFALLMLSSLFFKNIKTSN